MASSNSDMNERLQRLEDTVKRIREVEQLDNAELRRLGIVKGSRGVMGAFLLIALVFIGNVLYAYFTEGQQIFQSMHLIWFSMVIGVALLAYFGFIYRFTVSTNVNKGGVTFGTHPTSQS